jgi:hypothetical protein
MSRCPNCEKQARKERSSKRAAGEIEGTPDRNGRVVYFSEEEKKRRSELAKRLHAEGRFGGAAVGALGGQSLRRHRITDAVLEHFRQPDKQDLVIRAYESALKGKNKTLRLRAAGEITRIDEKVADRDRADRGGSVDPQSLTDDQLVELVAQGIEAMMAGGEMPEFIDATAEDADT